MLNIITALKPEAIEIIKHFKLKSNNNIYQNNKINLIITGQGKIKSAINTVLLLQKYPYKSINFGVAGSNKYEVNEGFFIHKIIDFETSKTYYPDFFKEKSSEIVCISKPSKYFQLVDMESSGFFEAAYKFLSVEKIILYKIVSDTPSYKFNPKEVPTLIKNHIHIIEELVQEDKNPFEDIEELIKSIPLTQTQKVILKNILIYKKLKNQSLPTVPTFKNKKEVKEWINSLTNSLY
ncbi:MAG: hypothetical protein ABGX23_05690 [Nautiliaceae bacterium]